MTHEGPAIQDHTPTDPALATPRFLGGPVPPDPAQGADTLREVWQTATPPQGRPTLPPLQAHYMSRYAWEASLLDGPRRGFDSEAEARAWLRQEVGAFELAHFHGWRVLFGILVHGALVGFVGRAG